jgi:hypothetical protein
MSLGRCSLCYGLGSWLNQNDQDTIMMRVFWPFFAQMYRLAPKSQDEIGLNVRLGLFHFIVTLRTLFPRLNLPSKNQTWCACGVALPYCDWRSGSSTVCV